MKRSTILLAVLVAVLSLSTVPLFGQHGGSGGHGGGGGQREMGGHGAMGSHGESDTSHMGAEGKGSLTTTGKSVNDLLSKNTKLASKLQSLLPTGTDLNTASTGFKNLGQFVAAVHVSKNLDIPFDQLKAKMAGPPAESLGKAIQQLKPEADSKTEATKATKQAKSDINESTS